MIAAVLLAALALDLALIVLAASDNGFSRVAGPFHIRLHDPHTLLVVAALLSGGLVALCWRTRARAWSFAAAAVTVATGAVAVTRSADTMFPVGDMAVIELYVRNALTGKLLVGPYSRFGWHHPGPVIFYVLAPFYAAAGRTTASLAAGAAAVCIASVALTAWACARSIGERPSAIVFAMLGLYLWRVPELTASAWNPHIVILPALALLVSCAAAMGGDTLLLPLAAILASVVAQTDAALVPLAAGVSLAAIWGVVPSIGRPSQPGALRNMNVAAWTLLAVWLLTISEELTRTPGNLTLLWKFFVARHGSGQPFWAAEAAWARMLSAPFAPGFPVASGGTMDVRGAAAWTLAAAAQLAALVGIARGMRKREPGLARLAALAAAAALVALWAVTRIEDRIMDHEVFWISGLGLLNGAVILAGAASMLPARMPERGARLLTPLAAGALFALCAAISFSQAERARDGRLPVTPTNPVAERLTGSVRQYLEGQGAHKPLVRIGEDVWGLAAGVLLQADRGRLPFAVEESWMPMFPQSFAATGEEDSVVAFGNSDEHAARMRVPGAVAIANFSNAYVDGLPLTAR